MKQSCLFFFLFLCANYLYLLKIAQLTPCAHYVLYVYVGVSKLLNFSTAHMFFCVVFFGRVGGLFVQKV